MLPQYEVVGILGRGGMGAVYKGRQKSLKRLVAIKILPLGMADDEMKFAERFQNEAQTMAAMNHPAIVSVHDFGNTEDGLLYFVMEFVDGTDLQKLIQADRRLAQDRVLAITACVCDALDYAHKRGVIHRDIKPANILIDQEGHVKVADFGLAKMHDPSRASGLTRTDIAMGSAEFMAPESRKPGAKVDHRADLFSLGVTIYMMLTGEIPSGMFKLPSRKVPGVDAGFDEIICRAMEQEPASRYSSAEEMRRDLERVLAPEQRNLNENRSPPTTRRAALIISGVVAAACLGAFAIVGTQGNADGEVSNPSVDEAFIRAVAGVSAEKQVALVAAKLSEINGVEAKVTSSFSGDAVTEIAVRGPKELRDISPVAALRSLRTLRLHDLAVRDIACLKGLKLERVEFTRSELTDISVLKDMPTLWSVDLSGASLLTSESVQGLKVARLILTDSRRLTDISFAKGMPLNHLNVARTGVRDLSPLAGTPITELYCAPDCKIDAGLLQSLPTLKMINGEPVK